MSLLKNWPVPGTIHVMQIYKSCEYTDPYATSHFDVMSLYDAPKDAMLQRLDAASAVLFDYLLRRLRYGPLLSTHDTELACSDFEALFMSTNPNLFSRDWVRETLLAVYRDALLPLTVPINGPGIRNLRTTESKNRFVNLVGSAVADGRSEQPHARFGAYQSMLVHHVAQSCADNLMRCPLDTEHAQRLRHLADYTCIHTEAMD